MTDGALMRGPRCSGVWAALAVLLAAPAVHGQQNPPTIGYVYPAGGRQGATFQMTVGGQFLQGAKAAHVSGRGVHASVKDHTAPLPPKQLEELREQLKDLQQRRQAAGRFGMGRFRQAASQPASRAAWTDDDEKTFVQVRDKLDTFARARAVPAFAESVTLEVKIDPDARCGCREIRLEAAGGLTNPMVFCVGRLVEFSKPVATGAARFGLGDERPGRRLQQGAQAAEPLEIAPPITVNGQITAGERDRYRFSARKGKRIIVAVQARQLVPYMADAVPGWFQAEVSVHDASGAELACADHYRFDPDPVVSCVIPADGQYTVEIADVLFRGREDFVYRMSIGTLPFVTDIFPLGGQAGGVTAVQVSGWNLPRTQLAVNSRDKAPGVYPLPDGPESLLHGVPFAVDDLPECLEIEPNDDQARAQLVLPPVVINGRIEQPGAWDVFRFDGRAGDTIVAEVVARRLGSPLDSAIRIADAGGKQLSHNDDFVDKAAGLITHQADSWLMAKLPADGAYYVHLCDAQRKAGPEYSYRLRISAPRPGFDLRVTPSSINVRGGETVPIGVHVIRRDGFDGEISLSLKNAPEGLSLSGGVVPAGQDQVRVTLTAPRESPDEPIVLAVEGRAKAGDREIVRQALPADDRMQAFANRHLVPADELRVCLVGRPFPRGSAKVLSPMPVRIPAGGEGLLEVALPSGPRVGEVHVELSDPPEGIAIQKTTAIDRGIRIALRCDAAKVKPGLKGNLIFSAFAERAQAEGTQASNRRVPLGTLPAVPFAVVDEH